MSLLTPYWSPPDYCVCVNVKALHSRLPPPDTARSFGLNGLTACLPALQPVVVFRAFAVCLTHCLPDSLPPSTSLNGLLCVLSLVLMPDSPEWRVKLLHSSCFSALHGATKGLFVPPVPPQRQAATWSQWRPLNTFLHHLGFNSTSSVAFQDSSH